jgi:hypothetical protein
MSENFCVTPKAPKNVLKKGERQWFRQPAQKPLKKLLVSATELSVPSGMG